MNFSELNLDPTILEGLQALNFDVPTPIQEQSYPIIAEGKDLVGVAQTGTGKTAAFVIPILQRIKADLGDKKGTKSLILAPTRELAQQIDEQIFALGYHTGVSSALVIGGDDFARQASAIKDKVDILVATPGRLIDQMKITGIDLSDIEILVLDEVDRMLDMGFIPDVTKIMNRLPDGRQNLLFSATMPGDIKKLINKFMKDPVYVEIEASKPAERVSQEMYQVDEKQKLDLVAHLFGRKDWESAIIFTATKKGTDQLYQLLKKKNIDAISIHGDRTQEEREKALRAFKNSSHPVIVATDVLSRGIDIDNVGAIINYDMPNSVEDYIHRVGRTGRYDKGGTAITFATKKDKRMVDAIKKKVGDQLTLKSLPGELKSGGDSKGDGKKDSNKGQKAQNNREDNKADKQKESGKSSKSDTDNKKSANKSEQDKKESQSGDKGKERGKEKEQDQRKEKDQTKAKEGKKGQDQDNEQVDKKKRAPRRIKKSRKQQSEDDKQKNREADKSDKQKQQSKDSGKKGERKVKGNTQSSNKGKEKSRGKQDNNKDENSSGSGSSKSRPPRNNKDRSGNINQRSDEQDVLIVPERIKKATEKNRKTLKPAKGIWGIIKSMIPRIK